MGVRRLHEPGAVGARAEVVLDGVGLVVGCAVSSWAGLDGHVRDVARHRLARGSSRCLRAAPGVGEAVRLLDDAVEIKGAASAVGEGRAVLLPVVEQDTPGDAVEMPGEHGREVGGLGEVDETDARARGVGEVVDFEDPAAAAGAGHLARDEPGGVGALDVELEALRVEDGLQKAGALVLCQLEEAEEGGVARVAMRDEAREGRGGRDREAVVRRGAGDGEELPRRSHEGVVGGAENRVPEGVLVVARGRDGIVADDDERHDALSLLVREADRVREGSRDVLENGVCRRQHQGAGA